MTITAKSALHPLTNGTQISRFSAKERWFYFETFLLLVEENRGLAWRSCPGIDTRSLGIFSGASDISMCPGVESAQDIPGSKDGRCVRVTTLPPSCAECLEILEL
jgi:hypothetical protein